MKIRGFILMFPVCYVRERVPSIYTFGTPMPFSTVENQIISSAWHSTQLPASLSQGADRYYFLQPRTCATDAVKASGSAPRLVALTRPLQSKRAESQERFKRRKELRRGVPPVSHLPSKANETSERSSLSQVLASIQTSQILPRSD